MGGLFPVLKRPPSMNEKLDQLEAMISQMKQAQSKFHPVTPWSKRPKPRITHPYLKQKTS